MSLTPIQPVPFPLYPISNITPFTYRDGLTFLELIESFRAWINDTIVIGLNDSIATLLQDFDAALAAMVTQYNDSLTELSGVVSDNQDVIAQRMTALTAQIADALTDLTAQGDTALADLSAKGDADIVRLQALFDTFVVELTDATMAERISSTTTNTRSALDHQYVSAFMLTGVNVDPTGGNISTGLQAVIDAAPVGAWCVLPPGLYRTNVTIHLRTDCSYSFRGATIRANAAIAGALVDTPNDVASVDKVIEGGIFDCANLAQIGFWAKLVNHGVFRDMAVHNTANHGFIFGDKSQGKSSFEIMAYALHVWRPVSTAACVPNSIGLWMQNAADSEINGVIVVGNDIGIQNDDPDNRFVSCHVWGWYPGAGLPRIAFEIKNNAMLIGCCSDSATLYGYHFVGGDSTIDACMLITAPTQVDNTVIGAKVETDAGRVAAHGNIFHGGGSGARLANDWVSTGPGTTILGQSTRFAANFVGLNNFPPNNVFGTPVQDKIQVTGNVTNQWPVGVFLFGKKTHINRITSQAAGGSGATFHVEQAGVSKSPVMAVGAGIDVSFDLNAGQAAYLVFDTLGTAVHDVSVVAAGYYVFDDNVENNG